MPAIVLAFAQMVHTNDEDDDDDDESNLCNSIEYSFLPTAYSLLY